MERMIDNQWVEVDTLKEEGKAWADVEAMFNEIDAGLEAQGAAGASFESSDAAGDLVVPVRSGGLGDSTLVQVDAGPERGQGVAIVDTGDMVDEIPGLTASDGRTGTKGSRSTLQRLRERASKKTQKFSSTKSVAKTTQPGAVRDDTESQPVQGRAGIRVEVSEKAAKPRGPAVKDTTEFRQEARDFGKRARNNGRGVRRAALEMARHPSKPAPGILSKQPQWVKDLFEAHFRSARTRELRHMPSGPDKIVDGKVVTPNRMKMSREDFAIGWLVLLEAVRREPAIVRARVVNGAVQLTDGAQGEGLPALSAGSNTIST